MPKKDDDTTPKAFRSWDPPGDGRKLVVHVYDTTLPLCRRLMERAGITEDQLEKLAAFLRESIVPEGPKSENRFLKAGGKIAGVMISEFHFTILGDLPEKASVPFWVDANEGE
jgi:hypothetical protein